MESSLAVHYEARNYEVERRRRTPKESMRDLRLIAKRRNGFMLSREWIGHKEKYEFKCECECHPTFMSSANHVLSNGRWCPFCANERNVSENRVRRVFEILFDERFPNVRLDWNVNPETGKKLELDGYCERLGIAFEHHGQQHYELGRFNASQEDLEKQIRRDGHTRSNCEANGVSLVEVPWNKCLMGTRLKGMSEDERSESALEHVLLCLAEAGIDAPKRSFKKKRGWLIKAMSSY